MSIPGMLRIPGMMAVAICVCFEKRSHRNKFLCERLSRIHTFLVVITH